MTVNAAAVELSASEARGWIEQSLVAGHGVSAAVLSSAPFGRGVFRGILPENAETGRILDFEQGGMIAASTASPVFAQILEELVGRGAACVVVEDDVARRTDSAVVQSSVPSAFIGDRVVSWTDLAPSAGAAAAEVVGRVGSGYPRNAFVVSRSAADIGLADCRAVPEDFGKTVAECLMAVVVGAYDDESYVLWTES